MRRFPSLNALRAFEAAARHESFTQAAQELCVTQGAVSHQVKALEAELGCRLFNREHRRLFITSAGQSYWSYATPSTGWRWEPKSAAAEQYRSTHGQHFTEFR